MPEDYKLMNYTEAREYVNKASVYGIVPGLDNISRLCALLGEPQDALDVIHIAGTNGKGSTGAFIEAVLADAGFKTGRFASPAVFEYREQWTAGGKIISEEKYAEYIGKIKNITDNEPDFRPTAFEIETALAFLFFVGEKCDIAVIEAGMGGGGDATNVIKSSLVSVITPIALDHAKFLGNTVGEIAAAKAGIIKENGTVVTARQPEEIMAIIRREAAKNHAALYIPESGADYEISLGGAYQKENAALAAEVCRRISGVTEQNIANGLKSAVWHGRFEAICSDPELIIDGAHNPHGAEALMKSVDLYFKGEKIIYITGVFADKDYEEIARITAPRADKIYAITPDGPRGLSNAVYAAAIAKFNPNVEAVTLDEALIRCLGLRARKDTVIIAFGSLSFLGSLKSKAEEIIRMRKCGRILQNAEFLNLLSQINEAESDRIYCKHGIEHLLDVARAAHILNLEKGLGIPKETVYGAALMHDIGRYAQYSGEKEHHISGAEAAKSILPRCGFSAEETAVIADAVRSHRAGIQNPDTLSGVIAAADKSTRLCMLCPAADTCKWKDGDKNIDLIV